MQLIRDGRFVPDDWLRPAPGETPPPGAKLLLPWAQLVAEEAVLLAARHPLGVEIANDADPAVLEPWIDRLSLIAVPFPKSSDGRGFSFAPRLRRMGFKGELRASGHLIADQYALARNCGFDTVEITEALAARQPEAHWLQAEHVMTLAYQRGYGHLRSIMSARWSAAGSSST